MQISIWVFCPICSLKNVEKFAIITSKRTILFSTLFLSMLNVGRGSGVDLLSVLGWGKCGPRDHFIYCESSSRPFLFSSAMNVSEKKDMCSRGDLFFALHRFSVTKNSSSNQCGPRLQKFFKCDHSCEQYCLPLIYFRVFSLNRLGVKPKLLSSLGHLIGFINYLLVGSVTMWFRASFLRRP